MAVLNSKLILSVQDGVSAKMRGISASLNAFRAQQRSIMSPFTGMIGRAVALGGAYVGASAGLRGTAGAALEFESAMADVRKVLDVNDEQFSNIRSQITGMSRELPVTAAGIAEIYANAAQSNVPVQELGKFAEMVAKVSVAWDTTQGETADALAKIKTQLGLGVREIGLYADAINHLSNNTAAKAPDLVDFGKRVAANGEMFGFSAEQTLAFGSSMISSGAESEVAATSFRNMGRALTIGTRATKSHREAFNRLGIDSVKTAKSMQKNALKTTLDVIEKIQKLPEWERISIASALFGDEARALMPVINNAGELRRQLGLVGAEAEYSGSAFKEYTVRASTVGNTLDILKNKFADTFRAMGDGMLPSIKEASLAIGEVLDSLGERATPLTQMTAAFKGVMSGLGYDGSIRDMINDVSDLILGKADGSGSADKIGGIFVRFEEFGKQIKGLQDNPLVVMLRDLAKDYGGYMLAAIGIGMVGGAISKLAKAMYLLSGAKLSFTILKGLAGLTNIADILTGGGKPGSPSAPKPPAGGGAIAGIMATLGKLSPWFAMLLTQGSTRDNDYANASADERQAMRDRAAASGRVANGPLQSTGRAHLSTRDDGRRAESLDGFLAPPPQQQSSPQPARPSTDPSGIINRMLQGMEGLRQSQPRNPSPLPSMPDPISALRSMTLKTQPIGTQQVQVMNPVRPNVHQTFNVTINEASAPAVLLEQAGAAIRSAVDNNYGDGGL